MDDVRLGALLRAARPRRGWRQSDVASRAPVSRDVVSFLERGGAAHVRLGELRAVAAAVEVDVDVRTRWRGGDGERLVSARHSGLPESYTRLLMGADWDPHPEASSSIWGERGVIDILAWHPPTRTLLVVEIKTQLVDVGEMLGTLDRKRRLAPKVGADLGLHARTVGVCVALLDTTTNHRRLRDHAATLRAALPVDGRQLRAWLSAPTGPIAALTFLSPAAPARLGTGSSGVRRVRVRAVPSPAPGPRSGERAQEPPHGRAEPESRPPTRQPAA